MWKGKAERADVIIVAFTPEYKGRFTAELWSEAQAIHELADNGTTVYIFDSETMGPSDIRANLIDEAPSMGSVSEWWAFCCDQQARKPEVRQVCLEFQKNRTINCSILDKKDIFMDVPEVEGQEDMNRKLNLRKLRI